MAEIKLRLPYYRRPQIQQQRTRLVMAMNPPTRQLLVDLTRRAEILAIPNTRLT
jgi:hypothetical protein